MKKLISAVLVLLALAAAAFFFLKVRRFLPEPPRGAELVPAETLFFAQFPSLWRTALRFPKTDLYKIWQEPEVQAFLEKPRQNAPQMEEWEEMYERVVRIAPGEAFAAITSVEGARSTFVGGFSYAGRTKVTRELLEKLRMKFKARHPLGRSDLAPYKNEYIETFTYEDGMVAECLRASWYFVANDEETLRATLERFDLPSEKRTGVLATDATYQAATAPLGTGLDLRAFARMAPLNERLQTTLAAAGQSLGALNAMPGVAAVAFATRIEENRMHDLFFVLSPGGTPEPPLARDILAMGGTETFLYYSTRIPRTAGLSNLPEPLLQYFPTAEVYWSELRAAGLKPAAFGEAFGPEVGALLQWPDQATLPNGSVAARIRDVPQAHAWISTIAAGAEWERTERAGISVFTAASASDGARFGLAADEKFVVMGGDVVSAAAALRRRRDGANNDPTDTSPVKAASQWLAAPNSAYVYLNTPAVFDRLYGIARPFITMSLAFSPDAGAYIDAGKLPPAEVLSRHLSPSVLSQSVSEQGILMESAGSLTLTQLAVGVVGGTFATAMPAIESAVSNVLQSQQLPALPPGATPPSSLPPTATPAPAPPLPREAAPTGE